MREKDWQGFLNRGAGREIAVAQLAPALVSHLGAADDKVYLHHDYAAKAVNKHGLSAMHFPLIFDTIDFGIAVADRDRHLSFFYFDKETNLGWFQVTVKLALTGKLYVATFYKQRQAEVARRLKLYRAIR